MDMISDQCLSSFCTRITLVRHLEASHNGIGNFKCYTCSVNFKSKAALIHNKEKIHLSETFKCDDCEESFTRIETLRKHKINHKASDGEISNFKCEFCQTVFSWKSNWQRHKRKIYDGDKTLKNVCHVCGESFCTDKQMKAHIDLCHVTPLE